MKRQYSLKGRKQFKEIYRKGKKVRGKGIRIFVLRNPECSNYIRDSKSGESGIRIGVTIDRKVGNAVIRNRLKRRMRSIVCELLNEIGKDNWIAIRPGIDALDYNYEELKNNIRQLLKKSGVIDNDSVQQDNRYI